MWSRGRIVLSNLFYDFSVVLHIGLHFGHFTKLCCGCLCLRRINVSWGCRQIWWMNDPCTHSHLHAHTFTDYKPNINTILLICIQHTCHHKGKESIKERFECHGNIYPFFTLQGECVRLVSRGRQCNELKRERRREREQKRKRHKAETAKDAVWIVSLHVRDQCYRLCMQYQNIYLFFSSPVS